MVLSCNISWIKGYFIGDITSQLCATWNMKLTCQQRSVLKPSEWDSPPPPPKIPYLWRTILPFVTKLRNKQKNLEPTCHFCELRGNFFCKSGLFRYAAVHLHDAHDYAAFRDPPPTWSTHKATLRKKLDAIGQLALFYSLKNILTVRLIFECTRFFSAGFFYDPRFDVWLKKKNKIKIRN